MWLSSPNYTPDDLSRIKARTLLLVADNDEYIPMSHSEALADAIPDAAMLIFQNADHRFPETHAEEFNAAIVNFLYWGD